jgi:hypothetical protein
MQLVPYSAVQLATVLNDNSLYAVLAMSAYSARGGVEVCCGRLVVERVDGETRWR